MTPALSIKGVGKRYKVFSSRREQLKSILGRGKKSDHEFWALKDIDLEVEPGTTLGILGRNGAGKSTLLRIISGVSQPTTGTVEVNGRMAAIFGVGAGFNPEFTGRENVMLNGLILGIDHGEILARFDDIAAFADIGEFMDLPVRTYSSGMRSRLGFAVAVNVEPEVLVIDEALSAGDQAFKKKAIQRMYDLRDSGTTVLFVSHSLGMVKQFCTDAILIHQGRLIASGTPKEVAGQYQKIISSAQEKYGRSAKQNAELDEMLDHEEEEDLAGLSDNKGRTSRRGTGEAKIHALELLDKNRKTVDAANRLSSGSALTARTHLQYNEALEESALKLTLYSKRAEVEVFSTNTEREETPLGRKSEGDRVIVDFTLETPLRAGPYVAAVTAYDPRVEESCLDRAEAAFKISRPENDHPIRGLVNLPATVEVHALEGQQSPSRSA